MVLQAPSAQRLGKHALEWIEASRMRRGAKEDQRDNFWYQVRTMLFPVRTKVSANFREQSVPVVRTTLFPVRTMVSGISVLTIFCVI